MADAPMPTPELSVPLSVLDRFLKLSQENHDAYSAMVSAVDSMSSKMMDLTDTMEALKGTIDKEQLAKVVNDAMLAMRQDLTILKTVRDEMKVIKDRQDALPEVLRQVAACNGDPQYNVLLMLSKNLEFEKTAPKDMQELAGALSTLLSIVAAIKARRGMYTFLAGVVVVLLLGTASEGAKTVIKFLMGVL